MSGLKDWRPIPGWEGAYDASPDGAIRSVDRTTPNGRAVRRVRGVVLSPKVNNRGYLCVHLSAFGRKASTTVHRLVAMTFIPNPDCLPEVNHLDGDKRNCAVSNLEWSSSSGNSRHSTANRLNPVAKLSDDQVRTIRRRAMTGAKIRHMAVEYGVAPACIRRVVRLRTYTWVT